MLGEYFVPAVEISSVIVDRMSRIAETFQIIGHRFNSLCLQNGFIWVFSGPEEADAHAG